MNCHHSTTKHIRSRLAGRIFPFGFQFACRSGSVVLGTLFFSLLDVQAQIGDAGTIVAQEVQIVTLTREAARRFDSAAIDVQILAPRGLAGDTVSSALFARRAAAVCGWLRNDNEYPQAMALARRAIQRLAGTVEDNPADRAERLYWEAWLEGEILGNRLRALDLLEAAEKLAPEDPRILEDALRWEQAVAEFGQ